DARRCIELRKTWFRGYSRLTAYYVGLQRGQPPGSNRRVLQRTARC
ncbi:hypothetical protein QZH41_019747, partial [Actinostola sp. cb2023]